MAKQRIEYLCSECGETFIAWLGQCPNCQAWNSFQEVKTAKGKGGALTSGPTKEKKIVSIGDIAEERLVRTSTGMPEVDRLLGGGMAAGSVILLGGEPGVGKSTLLLQFGRSGKKILYVTGEESAEQVQSRATRIEAIHENVSVLQDYSLESILEQAQKFQPDILLVDSIQAVNVESDKLFPGSTSQIRMAAAALLEFARENQVTVWMTGHITKEGTIAGPKLLEHMVDVVLYFESERFGQYRFVRAVKNRYGAVGEVSVFEMTPKGLAEVPHEKSLIHLDDTGGVGSILFPQIDGSRAMPVEVQVLATPSSFSGARRIGEGIDVARIHMIAATLEKFLEFPMSSSDIFVRVLGGSYLRDGGGDLALLIAMASSYLNYEIPIKWAAAGELSLTGKIRAPGQLKERQRTLLTHGISHVAWGGAPSDQYLAKNIQQFFFNDVKSCVEKLFEKRLGKG